MSESPIGLLKKRKGENRSPCPEICVQIPASGIHAQVDDGPTDGLNAAPIHMSFLFPLTAAAATQPMSAPTAATNMPSAVQMMISDGRSKIIVYSRVPVCWSRCRPRRCSRNWLHQWLHSGYFRAASSHSSGSCRITGQTHFFDGMAVGERGGRAGRLRVFQISCTWATKCGTSECFRSVSSQSGSRCPLAAAFLFPQPANEVASDPAAAGVARVRLCSTSLRHSKKLSASL